MVYVLDVSGNPLTPTKRHGKARHLLETGKAVCVKRCPFTIQLTYQNAGPEPEGLSLGVDCGSKHIGLSVSSEEQEYYSSEVELPSHRRNRNTILPKWNSGRILLQTFPPEGNSGGPDGTGRRVTGSPGF